MNLSHLSIEQYAHKFIKVKQSTLFEPTKQDKVKALLQKRCPLCSCKLYQKRDGTMWYCKSKRKDKFIIRDSELRKYF